MEYNGLNRLVYNNFDDIVKGNVYIVAGKRRPGSGGRYWDLFTINPAKADRLEFGNVRRFLKDDEYLSLFKISDCGIKDMLKTPKNIKTLADRIKSVYNSKCFLTTPQAIDKLMPKTLFNEMMNSYAEMGIQAGSI